MKMYVFGSGNRARHANWLSVKIDSEMCLLGNLLSNSNELIYRDGSVCES